ncbi:hypothetical protein Agub_g5939 [Astrephomene gubernaculifera]|uniref:Uncharacterized protein n=1 Tax=Astrephomene gubernaculifera TaxID=47775 RepID=A0AAD3DP26_9CHLO|nr:hypothetical protein Agub_g5939 [Astrephomene gubernaculifera]
MEPPATEPRGGRRFPLLRGVRRGLKAACLWTLGLRRGRPASGSGNRRGRCRRAAPPLASLSAAMLEPNGMIEMGDSASYAPSSRESQALSALQFADGRSFGNGFPLVLRPPTQFATSQPEGAELGGQDSGPWTHYHGQHYSKSCCCGAEHCNTCSATRSGRNSQHPDHSVQHLLAVGSRQWGNSGSWWDGRSLLRVKIYDFAIYANPVGSAAATAVAALAASRASIDNNSTGSGWSPADALVPSSCPVDVSLTIRACRNLPLPLLRQEFERILLRRHQMAGGRADDPALQELLSYFSRDKLPYHVLTSSPSSSSAATPASVSSLASSHPADYVAGAAGGGAGAVLGAGECEAGGLPGGGGDAVRKGAAITFSRSSGGHLVTCAGGQVLGAVRSPPLAEALLGLYLGREPVSKRAKAAAGAALLDLAATEGTAAATEAAAGTFGTAGLSAVLVREEEGGGAAGATRHATVPPLSAACLPRLPRYRYRAQQGERVLCAPGAVPGDISACVVELT